TGIRHSEFNASDSEPIHLLQIWILPNQRGLPPSYEDKFFDPAQKLNQWCLLASEDGENGAMLIHQDMRLYAAILSEQNNLEYTLKANRSAYLQVASGSVTINQKPLNAGDAAMLNAAQILQIKAVNQAEVLLFDLPI
ncbi:MAG: pirin family protein, partial [Methylotenera sp.]